MPSPVDPPPEPQKVIASFRWPRTAPGDTDQLNKAWAKGILLFADLAPVIEVKHTVQGKGYFEVTSTGYAMLKRAKNIYEIGRHRKHKASYFMLCKLIKPEEEPPWETYIVDMHHQTCSCPSFAGNKKYCKHLLGSAYWLNIPHTIAATGEILWQPPPKGP